MCCCWARLIFVSIYFSNFRVDSNAAVSVCTDKVLRVRVCVCVCSFVWNLNRVQTVWYLDCFHRSDEKWFVRTLNLNDWCEFIGARVRLHETRKFSHPKKLFNRETSKVMSVNWSIYFFNYLFTLVDFCIANSIIAKWSRFCFFLLALLYFPAPSMHNFFFFASSSSVFIAQMTHSHKYRFVVWQS